MIYPEQKADYFSKSWNSAEYQKQFDLLMDQEALIGVSEEGFKQLGMFEKIGQILKNFIGGTDSSRKERVQAAWLKFLYYGEAQGLLKYDHIQKIQARISHPYHHQFDPAIKKLFKKIKDSHQIASNTQKEHLKQLSEIVVDYHQSHASALRPGFWKRYFNPANLDSSKLIFFGDTPLQLYQKALNQNKPRLAFDYLMKAFEVKNHNAIFQKQLGEQLQILEEKNFFELEGEKRTIQELWLNLGQTAFENQLPDSAKTYLDNALKIDPTNLKIRLEMVKLYLSHKKYALAQPLLADLQKAFPNDLALQIQIGQAYWEVKDFDQAVGAFETAIKAYPSSMARVVNHFQMAEVYHRVGEAHLKKLIPNGNLPKAISSLTEAVKIDASVLKYQEDLFEAYDQEWKASPSNFAANYEKDWMLFLNKMQNSLIKKNQKVITDVLLECSRLHFQGHQNQRAHSSLKQAISLFEDNIELKIKALDLAIQNQDWEPYQSQWPSWEKEHYANPFLKEKIGDALWASNKNAALAAYQESLALFTQKLSFCQEDQKKGEYQKHMADIQARIGQNHLQTKPTFFKGIDFEKAIKNLESAASLDPETHSSKLFEAHLSAAYAEKQAWFADKYKVISHFLKAFQTIPQKGDYVIELLELYFENYRVDEAIDLYREIQKTPWANDLVLPAALWTKLGKNLSRVKDESSALKCFKRAYKLDSGNQNYKQSYFRSALSFTQSEYLKIQDGATEIEDIEHLEEMAEQLETCVTIGFDKVEKLKEPYKEHLSKIYKALAECYVKRCFLPQMTKETGKKELQKHLLLHKDDLEQALKHYDQALEYQPKNAAIHFDKAVLLEWMGEYEKALSAMEFAVKFQSKNPFYHKIFGSLLFAVNADVEKAELHQQKLANECADSGFNEDYQIWVDEFMCEVQTKEINPHSYTQQKKGWF